MLEFIYTRRPVKARGKIESLKSHAVTTQNTLSGGLCVEHTEAAEEEARVGARAPRGELASGRGLAPIKLGGKFRGKQKN